MSYIWRFSAILGFGVTLGVTIWGYIFGSLGLQKYPKTYVKERGGNHLIFVNEAEKRGVATPHSTIAFCRYTLIYTRVGSDFNTLGGGEGYFRVATW